MWLPGSNHQQNGINTCNSHQVLTCRAQQNPHRPRKRLSPAFEGYSLGLQCANTHLKFSRTVQNANQYFVQTTQHTAQHSGLHRTRYHCGLERCNVERERAQAVIFDHEARSGAALACRW
jgi:hypothetical protein